MMRAVVMHATGGPEMLEAASVPLPEGDGTLVKVAFAGVNYSDVYQRSGLAPVDLPGVPGNEGVGVVVEGSRRFAPGQRVAWTGASASYAQFVRLPDAKLVPVPDAVADMDACAAMMQGITAHYLVEDSHPARAGETAVVHAAAGGVGLFLLQLLRQRGVHTVAVVSTPAKAELARRFGAEQVLVAPGAGLPAEVRRLSGGLAHVVYDGVGQATFAASLASVRPHGSLVLYGHASGPVAPIDPMALCCQGSIKFTRPTMAHFVADPDEYQQRAAQVLDAIAGGTLRVLIGATYPLQQAGQAQRDLEARRTMGKLLLQPFSA